MNTYQINIGEDCEQLINNYIEEIETSRKYTKVIEQINNSNYFKLNNNRVDDVRHYYDINYIIFKPFEREVDLDDDLTYERYVFEDNERLYIQHSDWALEIKDWTIECSDDEFDPSELEIEVESDSEWEEQFNNNPDIIIVD